MHARQNRRRPSLRVFKILGDRQQWRCGECRAVFNSTVEIDHVVPLAEGGSNDPENLAILCVQCHAFKTQRESVKPYLDREGALHCRFCGAIFSKYFRHRHDCSSFPK